jgi:hypothetical protein
MNMTLTHSLTHSLIHCIPFLCVDVLIRYNIILIPILHYYRYWCYEDTRAFDKVDLLPIRPHGDCFDQNSLLPCGLKICYCYADQTSNYIFEASKLYEKRTKLKWPIHSSSSWMHFIMVYPTFYSNNIALIGQNATSLSRKIVVPWEWTTGSIDSRDVVFLSAVTYSARQNYCQQIPDYLMRTPVVGDCHSPYRLPLWGTSMEALRSSEDRLADMEWQPGTCRSRGFNVIHSVALNVTDCYVDERWITAMTLELPVLMINSSRTIFIA